jgi:ABC-type transport system involved in multi-copper enzyme maturation permease subunit
MSATTVDVTGAPQGSVLPAVVRSEATKLRTVRSTVWTLVATVVATIGVGTLLSLARVGRWDQMTLRERFTLDPTAVSLRGVFLAQLALGVLGVLVISSEYTTGMIRTTLTAVPHRRTVLVAKALVFTLVAFVVAEVACFVAFFAGQSVFASKHVEASLSDPGVLRAVVGAGVYLTLIGLLGLGLGTLMRRTAGAIATLFGLVLVAPALVDALPSPWNTNVGKLLPINAGRALFTVHHDSDLLSPVGGLVALLVAVGVVFAFALVAIQRRDA